MCVNPAEAMAVHEPEVRTEGPPAARSDAVLGFTLNFAAQTVASLPRLGEQQRAHLAAIALELLSATLTSCLDAAVTLTPDDRRRIRLTQINAFIARNLGDPQLSPPLIATAHHISLRYLHRLFRDEHGVTVAAWIRQSRLERCRRDLADPLLAGWSIERIAHRWGFNDLATFSRAFKQAEGVAPSAFRETARLA
jgi:AraC-like DNA-binding protein